MHVCKIREETKNKEGGVWVVIAAMQESRDRKSHLVLCATGREGAVLSEELGVGGFPRAEI